jgi:hypothetical protein
MTLRIVTIVVVILFAIAFIGIFGHHSILDALDNNKNKNKSRNPYTRNFHNGKSR